MTTSTSININTIIKILYKNVFFIFTVTFFITSVSLVYITFNKSYKADIVLYGNDRVLNEIGENSQFSLNSFDFFLYLKNHSKSLENKNLTDDKFLKELSSKLNAQSETGNPIIKVKFTSKSKNEVEHFSKEYTTLAQGYLLNKKNTFLDAQIKLLEEQYSFLDKNMDIRTTKDSLSDTLVSRLAFYRLLKNDTNPVVKFISLKTGAALNKKMVVGASFFLGLFLGILLSFVKEFSKTLDWVHIKSKND